MVTLTSLGSFEAGWVSRAGVRAPPPSLCHVIAESMSRFLWLHLFPMSDLWLMFFVLFRFFMMSNFSVVQRSQVFLPAL